RGNALTNVRWRRKLASAAYAVHSLARHRWGRSRVIPVECLGRLWWCSRRGPAVKTAEPVGGRRSPLDDRRSFLERLCCGPGRHLGFARLARFRSWAALDDG